MSEQIVYKQGEHYKSGSEAEHALTIGQVWNGAGELVDKTGKAVTGAPKKGDADAPKDLTDLPKDSNCAAGACGN
ncbi:hypothetical protein JCM24511_03374 [Saitozyma sp. JCM 24511]|nr:hypothetical protein JCM24511_03374 [Saitozyma sp. JCM 24511]